MRKIIAALAVSLILVLTLIPGVASAQLFESSVSRTVSNQNPSPGEIVTVYIKPSLGPFGSLKCYAVEEYLRDLQYTGTNTADSNPEGTIFINITGRNFEYKVKVPQDAYPGERFDIGGEFWTDPDNRQLIQPKNTKLTVAGPTDVPIVFVDPHYQSVDPGQTLTLNIKVRPQGKGVSAVSVTMRFDAGAMSVGGVELGDLLGTDAIPAPGYPKIDNAGGTVQIAAARQGATTPPTAEGVFAKITLTVGNEFAAQGTHLFTLEKAQVVDENALDVSGVIKGSGSVTIKPPTEILPDGGLKHIVPKVRVLPEGAATPGPDETPRPVECPRWDITADGAVNTLDLSALAADYEQSEITYPRSDINEDGARELKDHSLLAAHLGEFPKCGNIESFIPLPGPKVAPDLSGPIMVTPTPTPLGQFVPYIPGAIIDRSLPLWPDWTGSIGIYTPPPKVQACGIGTLKPCPPPPPPTREPPA